MVPGKRLIEDVRYALRVLRLNPGFASVAVLSLALGIGANTAIFSLVDAVLLRMLPVTDPERLVLLSDPTSGGVSIGTQGGERSLFTYEEFERLRDGSEAFQGMFASESNPSRLNVRVGNGPVEEARGKLVTGGYFEVLALGASRSRLVRQLLTESVTLSAIGGAVGVLFAYWSARVLVRLSSSGPGPIPLDVQPNVRVLAFTTLLSILTGLLFGLVPALRAVKVDLNSTLKENAHGASGGRARLNLGKLLVVAQVAMSLLLLIGAGLFVRTLRNLRTADLGYGEERLLIVRIDPLAAGYTGASRAALFRRVLENLRIIPGVRAVTLSENGLFSGTESRDRISVEGYHSDNERDNASRFDQVGPNYFSTVGIPILLGRDIGPQDTETSSRVCVVNEAFAKFYFGRSNPIGRRVTDEFPDTRATFKIVGVARDARDHRLRGDVPRRFYIPLFHPLGDFPPSAYYEIRTLADPESLVPAVRRKVEEIDAALPILGARSLTDLLGRSIRQERVVAQVSGFFSALALVLASIGLYGVLAYSIARRTHEIGIRMALGAPRERILGGVLRETFLLVAVGIAIGIPAAFACGRLVQSTLVGLAVLDPLTLVVSTFVLSAVAAVAGYVPARRASRVDPLQALRCE